MKIKVSAILLLIVLSFFVIKHCRDYRYQKLIDQLTIYRTNVELSETRPYSIDTSTFNLNEYMSIFNKLSVEKGYYLDYYYYDMFFNGEPIIIALEDGKQLNQILKSFPPAEKEEYSIEDLGLSNISSDFYSYAKFDLDPREHLITENTKYGYFQFLMFNVIGENFGLVWHSAYKDIDIICTKTALLSHFRETKASATFDEFSREERDKVKKINPSPKLRLNNDTCYISFLLFSDWGGYIRHEYPILTKFPYQVGEPEIEVLAEYSCNIIF